MICYNISHSSIDVAIWTFNALSRLLNQCVPWNLKHFEAACTLLHWVLWQFLYQLHHMSLVPANCDDVLSITSSNLLVVIYILKVISCRHEPVTLFPCDKLSIEDAGPWIKERVACWLTPLKLRLWSIHRWGCYFIRFFILIVIVVLLRHCHWH